MRTNIGPGRASSIRIIYCSTVPSLRRQVALPPSVPQFSQYRLHQGSGLERAVAVGLPRDVELAGVLAWMTYWVVVMSGTGHEADG